MASVAGKGKTVGGGTKTGQNTITRNMTRAGANKRQINAALRNARKTNAPITRV